jgi:hypothetical protein
MSEQHQAALDQIETKSAEDRPHTEAPVEGWVSDVAAENLARGCGAHEGDRIGAHRDLQRKEQNGSGDGSGGSPEETAHEGPGEDDEIQRGRSILASVDGSRTGDRATAGRALIHLQRIYNF